jgi:lipid-A-disaccharide synthase
VPRLASRQKLGLEADAQVVAILPGSRRSEIEYVGPRLLAAAELMKRERPALRFVLPVVPGSRALVEPMLAQHAPTAQIALLNGQSHEALAACDVTLIASGTATLEAALFKRPMVIAYAMNWLSWQMMKRMAYQPWVGLPNILLQAFAVPELLQEQATPKKLAQAALQWLDNPASCEALSQRFQTLHQQLRCNTAQAATDAIQKILQA